MVYGLYAEGETTGVVLDEHTVATGKFIGRSVDVRRWVFPILGRRGEGMSLIDQASLDPGYRQ